MVPGKMNSISEFDESDLPAYEQKVESPIGKKYPTMVRL